MQLITKSAELAVFCEAAAKHSYITIDTEFIREKTYWPILCLVQIAHADDARMIDPLAEGIDLAPLFALLANRNIVKVFHSGRQDIEIFYHLSGEMPQNIFDTQIAASVCGYGETASYESLVSALVGASVDKSSRYSDWAARPLSAEQLAYALSDVTHLRVIYEKLKIQIEDAGRSSWIEEEFAALVNPKFYDSNPEDAYKKIKAGSLRPKHMVVLRALAAWREEKARKYNLPRGRVVKDEVLVELALVSPKSEPEILRIRNIQSGLAKKYFSEILKIIASAMLIPAENWPQAKKLRRNPQGISMVISMLQLLLKVESERNNIAASMIAGKEELESLALGHESSLSHGWRYDVFGKSAAKLIAGKLKISLNPKTKSVILEDID